MLDDRFLCRRPSLEGLSWCPSFLSWAVRCGTQVNKVAGNFHFAAGHSYQQGSMHIHDMAPFTDKTLDFTHTIKQLSFGKPYPVSSTSALLLIPAASGFVCAALCVRSPCSTGVCVSWCECGS